MISKIDVSGRRFGKLIALEQVPADRASWRCQCDCGNVTVVRRAHLLNCATKSCGCGKVKHGMYQSKEYGVWESMVRRCHNHKSANYRRYGARGIRVAEQWRRDFVAWFNHIGRRPSAQHSIDRINNDGHYEPGNVRWATAKTQANNRRQACQARYVTLEGERLTRRMIAERMALPWMVYRGILNRQSRDRRVARS